MVTSEASRRTEGVAIIGEQAVLGIEERYTENLEQIRQSLTDEVISRIEEEAKKIEQQKVDVKKIGREHLNEYGNAIIAVNNTLTADLELAEKEAQKTIIACQNISCRFLEDLNSEIGAMSNRVGLSTDHLVRELLDGFERVLQKVKREAALFARKQFELSNKSNYEIAEAFLKSVDDLEEVMLKQIDSFTMRTNRSIDRTNEKRNLYCNKGSHTRNAKFIQRIYRRISILTDETASIEVEENTPEVMKKTIPKHVYILLAVAMIMTSFASTLIRLAGKNASMIGTFPADATVIAFWRLLFATIGMFFGALVTRKLGEFKKVS
ncbi:MAG: hypothetical protein ACTSR1_13955, partial [Candidatus Heimdallarchaeota archaeon]